MDRRNRNYIQVSFPNILLYKRNIFYNSRVRGSKQYAVEIIAISYKSTVRAQNNGLNNINVLI